MDVQALRWLLSPEGQRLLSRITEEAGSELAADADLLPVLSRLRREHLPALVAAAATQVRLRGRARQKFGADAAGMYFTRAGLEQATRMTVAAHRAERYRAHLPLTDPCVDLCCGVGGDLIALARAGCRVVGVDHDPLTAEVARANIDALGLGDRACVRLVDVEAEPAGPAHYGSGFCDPQRRTAHARVFDPAAYSPPLPRALALARGAHGGAVKVAPGIPHHLLPSGSEAEWLSDSGELKEATLWTRELATGAARRATLLPAGHTLTADPAGADPPVSAPLRYLYEPDDAVVRAGLVAELTAAVGGALLEPTIAYVTSDRRVQTPFARAYEITDALPFSLNRLRALLRERRVGTVTIKKRGSAVDVERLRRQLRPCGPEAATVVLTRLGGAHYALLCRALPATDAALT